MELPFQSVCLIGSEGRMAQLLAGRCRRAGIRVCGADRPLTDEALQGCVTGSDIVVLCVPAAVIPEVCRRIAPLLDGTQVLADITSVKEAPLAAMQAAYGGPVVGTHPMFGPDTAGLTREDLRVAVAPSETQGSEAAAVRVRAWVELMGFTPFSATARQHDEAAALIQGLNFATTVAYLATLAHREELAPFLTPSFRRRLVAARKMLTEDADLFTGIYEANPRSQQAVRSFRNFLQIAAGGDMDVLVQRARWWWTEK